MGDVLIHAGDLTYFGVLDEIEEALLFLNKLPHKHKLVVAGNHDFYFDQRFPDGHLFRNWRIKRPKPVSDMLTQYQHLTYLQDNDIVIDGIKFYGSPWQPWFQDWAFNFPADIEGFGKYAQIKHSTEAAKKKWAEIPEDTNVLITHGPPWGFLDQATDENDNRVGCPELRNRITDGLPDLKSHIFGHIHEQYGLMRETLNYNRDPVTFVNAAICNRNYEPINAPIVIDI